VEDKTDNINEEMEKTTQVEETLEVATEADNTAQTEPEGPTAEQQADPDFDILEAVTEKERDAFFKALENQAQQVIMSGNDQILQIHVRPGCLETFMEWYATAKLHPIEEQDAQVKQSIQIIPNEKVPTVHLHTYAQMEAQWLMNRYAQMGLFKTTELHKSPVRFTPDLLKLLYAIECLDTVTNKNNKIIQAPAAAAFDPKSIGMKTK